MATITPAIVTTLPLSPYILWADITTTTDTVTAWQVNNQNALAGAVQFTGTFAGGSTAVLQGSIDGVTYATLKDVFGNSISCTAAGLFEFSTSCPYIKPAVTGGAADDVDVYVIFRG